MASIHMILLSWEQNVSVTQLTKNRKDDLVVENNLEGKNAGTSVAVPLLDIVETRQNSAQIKRWWELFSTNSMIICTKRC